MTLKRPFLGTDMTLITSDGAQNLTPKCSCAIKVSDMVFISKIFVHDPKVAPYAEEQQHGLNEVWWPQIMNNYP